MPRLRGRESELSLVQEQERAKWVCPQPAAKEQTSRRNQRARYLGRVWGGIHDGCGS